jgi:hypothetical protein
MGMVFTPPKKTNAGELTQWEYPANVLCTDYFLLNNYKVQIYGSQELKIDVFIRSVGSDLEETVRGFTPPRSGLAPGEHTSPERLISFISGLDSPVTVPNID